MHIRNNQEYFKRQFRNMFIYMLFLIITTSVLLNICASYWMTGVLEEEFVNDEFPTNDGSVTFLYNISKMDHLWNTIDNIFFESLYWNYWYKDYDTTYKVMQDNIILGTARLRQVQVKTNSCDMPDDFNSLCKKCYAEYSTNTEFKEPFGLKNGSAWTYTDTADINCVYYYGSAGTYGCDGYFQILSPYSAKTKRLLNNLKRNLWITRQSRAVIIDMNIYNGNMNAVCILKIVFELPATGGVVASRRIETVKLVPYADSYDYFILACELICVGYFMFYTREMVLQIKTKRWKYLTKKWHYIDFLIICMGCGFFIVRLYIIYLACVALEQLYEHPETYVNFGRLGYWYSLINTWTGLLFFLIWIKVFKFMNLNRTLAQLKDTFTNSAYNISGFMVTFIICFIAYGQLGYLLFGEYIYSYSSVSKSIITLFKMIHGEINYAEIERTNFVLSPFFFCTFIFIIYFLLLNMFLAIINDSYTMIRNELSSILHRDPSTFLNIGASRVFAKCKRIHRHFAKQAAKESGDMKNVKRFLKLAKYTDIEIELLFSMYNFGNNKDISDNDMRTFAKEILKTKRKLFEAADYIQGKYGEPELISSNDLRTQRLALDTLEQNIGILNEIVDEIIEGARKIKPSR